MSRVNQFAAFVVRAKYEILWGYLVAVWLWDITLELFQVPSFYEISPLSLGLALAILAAARFSDRSKKAALSVAYAVTKGR